jgi:hypothetical protein
MRDRLEQQQDAMNHVESDLNELLDNGLVAEDDMLVSQVLLFEFRSIISTIEGNEINVSVLFLLHLF